MKSTRPSREELLEELESIHSYLSEEESGEAAHIPLLTQAVAETEKSGNTSEHTPPKHKPVKQEIREVDTLNDTSSKQSKKKKHTANTHSENPFLPPHIRRRLKQNKELISEIHSQSQAATRVEIQGDLLEGFNHAEGNNQEALTDPVEQDKIIDELVAEYLPKIEARLRDELKQKFSNEK